MNIIPIYLASKSLRRCDLLKQIDISYTLVDAEVDEAPLLNERARNYTQRMAITKAQQGQKTVHDLNLAIKPILGADTVISLNDQVFGKPKNKNDAQAILRELSGKTHQVLSAIAIIYKSQLYSNVQISQVTFKTLSKYEIMTHCECQDYYDKAGGYAIQGSSAKYISHLSGSYSGVMGLPLYELNQLLNKIKL